MKKSFQLKNKRGQVFSVDLVVTVIAFIIIFVFLISFWNLNVLRFSERKYSDELQLLSFQTTDILIKSPGVPNNWEDNSNNISVIGLGLSLGYLDANKVNTFLGLDYDLTKEKFNIERFDYRFELLSIDGEVLNTSGANLSNNLLENIAVSRIVMIGNETRLIQFNLWRE